MLTLLLLATGCFLESPNQKKSYKRLLANTWSKSIYPTFIIPTYLQCGSFAPVLITHENNIVIACYSSGAITVIMFNENFRFLWKTSIPNGANTNVNEVTNIVEDTSTTPILGHIILVANIIPFPNDESEKPILAMLSKYGKIIFSLEMKILGGLYKHLYYAYPTDSFIIISGRDSISDSFNEITKAGEVRIANPFSDSYTNSAIIKSSSTDYFVTYAYDLTTIILNKYDFSTQQPSTTESPITVPGRSMDNENPSKIIVVSTTGEYVILMSQSAIHISSTFDSLISYTPASLSVKDIGTIDGRILVVILLNKSIY